MNDIKRYTLEHNLFHAILQNYGSVHLEKAASDLTLLKKENRVIF
jgi:Zn-dependent peptidase ImmA (M78 family)